MLDSAGKRVAEQGQLQFLAERRERLDVPDGCRQRIPRARRSHRKRPVAEGGSTCQRQDQCRRRSRVETATWSRISRDCYKQNCLASDGGRAPRPPFLGALPLTPNMCSAPGPLWGDYRPPDPLTSTSSPNPGSAADMDCVPSVAVMPTIVLCGINDFVPR